MKAKYKTIAQFDVHVLKKQLQADARLIPRADGRSVQFVVGRFRFAARAKLQAALLQGNSLLATEVGL